MISSPKLSVVIPAFNEERRLPATLTHALAYLRRQTYSWEVVVVDDGSRDGTSQVISSFQEERVRLLRHEVNHGKGYAVRTGLLAAGGRVRLFMDADNSTTVDQVEAFLPIIESGADIVIGSRRHPRAVIAVHQPWYKEAAGDVGNMLIQALAIRGFRDTQAGFKAFTARAAESVFPRLTLDGFGFDAEALAIARRLGLRIRELPIVWRNDPESKVSGADYVDVIRQMAWVRWNLTRGAYRRP